MTTVQLVNGKKYLFDRILFQKKSPVLRAYFDIIIQPSQPPEVNNYSKLLVDYFVSNGKVCSLFEEASIHYCETESDSLTVKNFKLTSALCRLFTEYSNEFLLDFAKNALQDMLKSLVFIPSIPQEELITRLCKGIHSSLKTLPPHFIRSIQYILEEIDKYSFNSRQWVIQQLFFVRFLCPLIENPLFVLDGVKQEEVNLNQKKITQFSQFISQVVRNGKGNDEITTLVKEIIYYFYKPISVSITESGINLNEQTRLHSLLVQVFKDHSKEIVAYLNNVESKDRRGEESKLATSFVNATEPTEIKMNEIEALNELNRLIYSYDTFYSERIEEIEKENKEFEDYLNDLRERIQYITKQIDEEKQYKEKLKKEIEMVERMNNDDDGKK